MENLGRCCLNYDPQADVHAPFPAAHLRPFVHAHLHDSFEPARYAMRLGYLVAATYSLSRNQVVIRLTGRGADTANGLRSFFPLAPVTSERNA